MHGSEEVSTIGMGEERAGIQSRDYQSCTWDGQWSARKKGLGQVRHFK